MSKKIEIVLISHLGLEFAGPGMAVRVSLADFEWHPIYDYGGVLADEEKHALRKAVTFTAEFPGEGIATDAALKIDGEIVESTCLDTAKAISKYSPYTAEPGDIFFSTDKLYQKVKVGRCRDCQFWRKDKGLLVGWCGSNKVESLKHYEDIEPSEGFSVAMWGDSGHQAMHTAPDFGCVNWSTK